MIRNSRTELAEPLADIGLPAGALIFVTRPEISDDWSTIRAELTEAFTLSRAAARVGGPVLFVVDGDDLLGRNGPGRAMVACGVLSGARTLALECRKSGVPINVLALEAGIEPEVIASWVDQMLQAGGPHGELIRLGGDHLGKVLP
ncbi:MAG: hypothetical protein ACRDWH_01195 [Acidimicrobiia bacterium]